VLVVLCKSHYDQHTRLLMVKRASRFSKRLVSWQGR